MTNWIDNDGVLNAYEGTTKMRIDKTDDGYLATVMWNPFTFWNDYYDTIADAMIAAEHKAKQ